MSAGAPFKVSAIGPDGRPLQQWLRRFNREFGEKVVRPALVDALNRTAEKANTAAVKQVAGESKLPAKAVRSRARKLKATRRTLDAGAAFYYKPISPIGIVSTRQTRKGVTAGKHRFPGSFIATGTGNRQQVFHREGARRLPIASDKVEFQGENEAWPRLLGLYARTFLPQRLAQQLDYRSRKLGLK